MTEYYLTCNVLHCRKQLKLQAWATTCSHIFCTTHGECASEKRQCLACGISFSTRYDIVIMDLNPSEQHKNMILSGLSPETTLDILSRSIRFWTYQVYHEKVLKDAEYKAAKEYSDELKDYCQTLVGNHNIQIQKLNRDNQNLQNELSEKTIQIEELVGQVLEKSRLIKDLQGQCESLKRNMYNFIYSAEDVTNGHKNFLDESSGSFSGKYNSSATKKGRSFKLEPKF